MDLVERVDDTNIRYSVVSVDKSTLGDKPRWAYYNSVKLRLRLRPGWKGPDSRASKGRTPGGKLASDVRTF
eukprot:5670910-Amphidinium_carterae.1